MKIGWSIKIPAGAKLKIKDGESVKAGDKIYEYRLEKIERLPLVGWQNLGIDQRKTILQNILKRNLVKDEVLGKNGWFSHIVLKSPGTGKCLGVDEFGNIELETEKEEIFLAPISTKKVRIEEHKVVFELKGIEFEASGINQGKAWGNFELVLINDLEQVGSFQKGQVVAVENSLETATKAEAIGVVGLILVDFDKVKEFEDSDIPVVLMEKSEIEKLIKYVDGKLAKIWLNATASKVLVIKF